MDWATVLHRSRRLIALLLREASKADFLKGSNAPAGQGAAARALWDCCTPCLGLDIGAMFGANDKRTVMLRLMILAGFVAAIWVIQLINSAVGYGLNPELGLIPRRVAGLDGILGMPLLHVSYPHLIANTPPLLLMGALIALTARRALLWVNGIIVGLGGALVWVLGGHAIHVGASGLVFGWFGFLVVRGLVDRSLLTLATSLLIAVAYGSILWGVLPGQDGISWEAHLFGALAGAAAAYLVRTSSQSDLRRGSRRSL